MNKVLFFFFKGLYPGLEEALPKILDGNKFKRLCQGGGLEIM